MFDIDERVKPVKKILILAANPKFTPKLRLDLEMREIDEGLRRSKYRKQFELDYKHAVRRMDFRRAILDYEPQIVHFAGHGEKSGLQLEDKQGKPAEISSEALAGLFKLFSGHVECVVLSACYSASQAEAINRHIDFVIGMQCAISDEAAIKFSVGFYDALGAGRSIEDAFEFGRIALMETLPEKSEHLTPQLHKRMENPKRESVNITIRIETTGDLYDASIAVNTKISAVKKNFMDKLMLPEKAEAGEPVTYYLRSKTRGKTLIENKTLYENSVRNNEVFVFVVEAEEDSRVEFKIGGKNFSLW
ncbi:MAG: CHAT domain-containing protein [bacterium]|nr:CHAT domain-containing protein [bacterium]